MLSYLCSIRPDISIATYQVSKFSSDPKVPHFNTVKRIVKYLVYTKYKGLIIIPNILKGLECFVDMDFARAYDKENSENPENILLRMGYIIKYTNYPGAQCYSPPHGGR